MEKEKYWSGGIDRETSSVDVLVSGDELTIAIYHAPEYIPDKGSMERGVGITKLSSDELRLLINMLQEAEYRITDWRSDDN
jgi:hypothetical protein